MVTEHFKEYLPYQPFLVKTNNNPLTYIMTKPNLDATGHLWVGALARFNLQLEYQQVECLAALCHAYVEVLFGGQSAFASE